MDLNYFVCTLGQAARSDINRPFHHVNHLIDFQSRHHPDLPAVGFMITSPSTNETSSTTTRWDTRVLTFRQVEQASKALAEDILSRAWFESSASTPQKQTVALICPSSADFLLIWLALMRLGYSVLLIAPQCSPSAVAELCRSCDARVLLYDNIYLDLAEKSRSETINNGAVDVSIHSISVLEAGTGLEAHDVGKSSTANGDMRWPQVQPDDVAYLHHTSGTSTGIPKPIPQSHRAAVGVLPQLDGIGSACFTTTPLYHGGIADLFRAWSSSALIWLFPGKEVPITAANIVKCLHSCSHSEGLPPVRYFSSVPYVLQMLYEDPAGLEYLQKMDIVGVGGAALPDEVGSHLVNSGVNLISRFGSAECGFIMSSHRDYTKDKEWQFLRLDPKVKRVRFEEREGGLSELIVLSDWPHVAKRNRSDGSYATADLFQPHPTIPDAWRYHSRADSQLTLITGKKFDPAPLESAICAATNLLSDALIFGNGKPYPGVLLFRSKRASSLPDDKIVQDIWPTLERLNQQSQSHAKISRNMLVCLPHQDRGLEKSSKGTIIRGKAEERYAGEIDGAYSQKPLSNTSVAYHDLEQEIMRIVRSVLSNSGNSQTLSPNDDLFSHGIDSIASIQIRNALLPLTGPKSPKLPMTIVQDCGTVSKLHKAILALRQGQMIQKSDDDLQLMQDLVKKYSVFDYSSTSQVTNQPQTTRRGGITVLLTGPTGSLGSHILHQLLHREDVSHIHLLVRGATPHAARERVHKALSNRALSIPSVFDPKVTIHPCKLSEPHLGLSEHDYQSLAANVDIIYHLAWSVNFLLPLRSFATNDLAGLHNLLIFAITAINHRQPENHPSQGPKFIFCSSVASVLSYPSISTPDKIFPSIYQEIPIPEKILSHLPQAAGPTGYARSKWVAESICWNAAIQIPELRAKIAIVRVGQLSGATDSGIWSMSEAYPLMLAASHRVRSVPDLGTEELVDWIPVDVAARGFVDLLDTFGREGMDETKSQNKGPLTKSQGIEGAGLQENNSGLSEMKDFDSYTPSPEFPIRPLHETNGTINSMENAHTTTKADSVTRPPTNPVSDPTTITATNSSTQLHQPRVYHVISPLHQSDSKPDTLPHRTHTSAQNHPLPNNHHHPSLPPKPHTTPASTSKSTTQSITTWSELTHHLPLSLTPTSQWLDTIERDLPFDHPALKLTGFWRDVYTPNPSEDAHTANDADSSQERTGRGIVRFDTALTCEAMPSLGLGMGVEEGNRPAEGKMEKKKMWTIDADYVKKVYEWCCRADR